MANDNLKIWDALSKTDPDHTKKFKRAGGFSGTAIKPIYLTRKMTEYFGPAGLGWGMEQPKFDVVPTSDQVLVYCTVALWWGNTDHVVYGVGGDIVRGANKYGPYVDDEAFKKSYTDALSNAMKQIGVGADVHMGQHDDDKYVSALKEELHSEEQPKANGNGQKFGGPLTKTDLKARMRAFAGELHDCNDASELDGLLESYRLVIEQCKRDLPDWWLGDGKDNQGAQAAINNRRAEIEKRKELAA